MAISQPWRFHQGGDFATLRFHQGGDFEKTILRPPLVLIFQGEADGDGLKAKFELKKEIFYEKHLISTKNDSKTTFGIDFSRRS